LRAPRHASTLLVCDYEDSTFSLDAVAQRRQPPNDHESLVPRAGTEAGFRVEVAPAASSGSIAPEYACSSPRPPPEAPSPGGFSFGRGRVLSYNSSMTLDRLLGDLNSAQIEAVRHTEGPLLVLAGAGSGKTRVITRRIASLIAHCGVRPEQILAVTFTNKAAEEMKRRVEKLLGAGGLAVSLGTFHSTCVRILRRHASLLGMRGSFLIYDEADQLALLRECLRRLDFSERVVSPSGKAAPNFCLNS